MELKKQEMSDGLKIIYLVGRMDIAGTKEVDLRFTAAVVSQNARVVVDLSGVSFLASIGMTTLVSSARALKNRGGAMALVNPQPLVHQALTGAGIDSFIPIYPNIEEACRALQTP